MCGQTGRPVDQGLEPCVRRWRYADCARLAQVVKRYERKLLRPGEDYLEGDQA